MQHKQLVRNLLDEQPHPLLFSVISGAHLFGFPSPDSDIDIRGVHILPLEQVISLKMPKDTINLDRIVDGVELDLTTHDVKKFFELLLNKGGNTVEQIFSPLVLQTTPEHEELKAIVPQTLTVHHAHHYFGFSQRKWHDDFLKKRTAKALLYVYRVLLTGIHLMSTGEVQSNLVTLNETYKLPYINDLIARKMTHAEKGVLADVDMDFYEREYVRLTRWLEEARDQSSLPQHPTGKEALSDLLVRIRLKNR
jgi:uncharacterized protein